ncbi:hypothetical protein [Undibacterium danionis]|uniref:Uncharacterized protein n=1 Tax=Undibacterium danionis TaxID=1812100 RepID=A0ABV6IHI6_9BURK
MSELANELKKLAERDDLAWLSNDVILSEVDAAVISLTRKQADTVRLDGLAIQTYGNSLLYHKYLQDKLRTKRTLSLSDAKALAASLELDAVLCTDEWPLRYVAGHYDYDNGNPVELLSTVHLIALLEKENLISREVRIKTYSDWLKDGTALLRETPEIYVSLFNELPPTAQG